MRIVSGIRPSGDLHIGNYLGAIKQWVLLQQKGDCFFFIADLHAITTPFDPKKLKENIFDTLATYLACGLSPKKSTIFLQSLVKEHTELAWILSVFTPYGDLKRMTQFKEKSKQYPESVNAGLFNYPVLMAADILIYKADFVPVGRDQSQHLELAREIARKFNKKFGNIFKEPKPIFSEGEKIMSLTNPLQKMSKTSDPNSCIFLDDTPEKIKEKIMKAVTDSGREIIYSPSKKPGISNLLKIFSLFSGKKINELEKEFEGKGYEEFKRKVAELLILKLKEIRERKFENLKRKNLLEKILKEGSKKAQKEAQKTLKEVKKKIGFLV